MKVLFEKQKKLLTRTRKVVILDNVAAERKISSNEIKLKKLLTSES